MEWAAGDVDSKPPGLNTRGGYNELAGPLGIDGT